MTGRQESGPGGLAVAARVSEGGVIHRGIVQLPMPDTDPHPPMTGSRSNVADRVIVVLRRVRQERIEPTMGSALVADLGFDSLRLLELIAELEDEFGIYIPLNDVPAIATVGQAVDRVVALLREQGRA